MSIILISSLTARLGMTLHRLKDKYSHNSFLMDTSIMKCCHGCKSGRPLAVRIVTSVEPAIFSDIIDVIVHQEDSS
ncbi:unnamed protein product [Onchocerca ochengi]|uniref:Secreted protein n=1 Tax=Onchocerca ochengi TaxID=42157 RepID=A0A182E6T6_ONCOC|nr:unnamed protein product [Onchocerca ochengi]